MDHRPLERAADRTGPSGQSNHPWTVTTPRPQGSNLLVPIPERRCRQPRPRRRRCAQLVWVGAAECLSGDWVACPHPEGWGALDRGIRCRRWHLAWGRHPAPGRVAGCRRECLRRPGFQRRRLESDSLQRRSHKVWPRDRRAVRVSAEYRRLPRRRVGDRRQARRMVCPLRVCPLDRPYPHRRAVSGCRVLTYRYLPRARRVGWVVLHR